MNAQPGVAGQAAPVVVQQVPEEHGFFYYLARIVTWMIILGLVATVVRFVICWLAERTV